MSRPRNTAFASERHLGPAAPGGGALASSPVAGQENSLFSAESRQKLQ